MQHPNYKLDYTVCEDKPVSSVPTSQRILTSISTTNDDTKAMVTFMNYFYFKFTF